MGQVRKTKLICRRGRKSSKLRKDNRKVIMELVRIQRERGNETKIEYVSEREVICRRGRTRRKNRKEG